MRIAGVDSIEHGTYMTDEIRKLMKDKGTWYVPTILAGVFVGEMAAKPGCYPEIVRSKALAVGPQIQRRPLQQRPQQLWHPKYQLRLWLEIAQLH